MPFAAYTKPDSVHEGESSQELQPHSDSGRARAQSSASLPFSLGAVPADEVEEPVAPAQEGPTQQQSEEQTVDTAVDYSQDRGAELAKPIAAVSLAATAAGVTSAETTAAFAGDTSLLPGLSGSQTYGALAGVEALQGIIAIDAGMTIMNGRKMMQGTEKADAARYQLGKDKVSDGAKGLAGAAASMTSSGLKTGAAVASQSGSYVGDFAGTAGSLAGAAGLVGAVKGGYDLYTAGKTGKQAYQRHAKAKADQKKALTPQGRGWLGRVQNRQKWKGAASAVKGVAAVLGVAGAVASMLTPVGWAVALAGAGVGLILALSKIGKKVGDAKSQNPVTKGVGRVISGIGKGFSAVGSGVKRLFGFGKKKTARQAADGAAESGAPPQAAAGGEGSRQYQSAEPRGAGEPTGPGPDGRADHPAAVEERAEAIELADIEPTLNLDSMQAAQLEPDDLRTKAAELKTKAEELEVEYETNRQVATEVRGALIADPLPLKEKGAPATEADEVERKLGGDGGLVISVLDIPPQTAISPSGEELINKRMSALDGI